MSETTQLTEGQQGVIRAYDNEIAKHQRNLEAAKQAWVNGASYDDVREHDREIERLSQWRRDELEAFARQNEAQATPAAPNETPTLETQEMTPAMQELLFHFVAASPVDQHSNVIRVGSAQYKFSTAALVGLISRGYVTLVDVAPDDHVYEKLAYVISEAGKAAIKVQKGE